MPNPFRKLDRGANRFFGKVASGADKFFTKTLPKTVNTVDDGIKQASNVVGNVANKIEKFTNAVAPVAQTAALSLGQPEIASGIGSAQSGIASTLAKINSVNNAIRQ
jgi:hypothetical protein